MNKLKSKYENIGIIMGIRIDFDCDSDTDSDAGFDSDGYKKKRK